MKTLTHDQRIIAEQLMPIAKATARRFEKHRHSDEIFSAAMLGMMEVASRSHEFKNIHAVAKMVAHQRAVRAIRKFVEHEGFCERERPEELPGNDRGTEMIDDRDELDSILRKFPERTREMLTLVYIDGLSHSKASRQLGCSRQLVSAVIAKALGL